jgi:hypothetical protein
MQERTKVRPKPAGGPKDSAAQAPAAESSALTEVVDVKAEYLPMRIDREPSVVLQEATKAAKALQDVIQGKKHKVMFGGEQYLELEDWQTLGRFYGLSSRITGDKYIAYGEVNGFEANADVIRTDGAVVSSATAMCLNDEKNWKGKPLFQLRSMAQSRAAAKAFRLCLSWVAVLAGYRGTPAEEMDGVAKTVEEVVSEGDTNAGSSGSMGGRDEDGTTAHSSSKSITLTGDQLTMLKSLGGSLSEPWLNDRYGRELVQVGGFLPVRDKLLGLHREQCGESCKHWTQAVQALGGDE